ncbi:MAG: hypothetical protein WBP16_07210 [Ferruginibacter sp.]
MKLRIKGNSLRIRLTKTEVSKLADTGYLQEQTVFPNNTFTYALQGDESTTVLFATLGSNKITMHIPASFIENWPENDIVGINATMPFFEDGSLYLLVEKDFVCLDETTEDQSDNYDNPKKNC